MSKPKKESSHISHFIPVYDRLRQIFSRNNAPFLIVSGITILVVFNLIYQRALPSVVTRLLKDPYDSTALKSVLQGSNDPVINSEIIALLTHSGEEQVANTVQTEKNQIYETINKITLLLKDHVSYPDGYAYRAVLYFKLHDCVQSLKDIQKAITLDPNRAVFTKLHSEISACW